MNCFPVDSPGAAAKEMNTAQQTPPQMRRGAVETQTHTGSKANFTFPTLWPSVEHAQPLRVLTWSCQKKLQLYHSHCIFFCCLPDRQAYCHINLLYVIILLNPLFYAYISTKQIFLFRLKSITLYICDMRSVQNNNEL